MILLVLLLFSAAVYLFILFIVKRDHGHKEPSGALFSAAGFGLGAVILAGYLNNIVVPEKILNSINTASRPNVSPAAILGATLCVGLIEEGLKNIPLALFIFRKRYFDEMTDGIIYFGLAGLSFGIVEDITYALNYGSGVGLTRIIMEPYLHSAFCILFGSLLIRYKLLSRNVALPVLGFAMAVAAHALFDFLGFTQNVLSGSLMALMAVGLNITLFVMFRRSQIIDEKHGQSTIGENKFCRHCGRPNPGQLLYCSYCGKLS